MKTLKSLAFAALLLLAVGFSANAQDLLVLKDGSMVEAKVIEISPSEIKYYRFDYLDGPVYAMPADRVMSIRFEDGNVEIIEAAQPAVQQAVQTGAQPRIPKPTSMNPDRFTFGIAAEPSGFLLAGPSLTAEFTKGSLFALIDLRFPGLGFGSGSDISKFGMTLSFNKLWRIKYGAIYLGGMAEMAFGSLEIENYYIDALGKRVDEGRTESGISYIGLALNVGYKVVFSTGMYLRAGAYVGLDIPMVEDIGFMFRPGISVGYDF